MNGIQYVKYLLVAFFSYAVPGFSQPGLTAFTVADGLSQGMVTCMLQDQQGFMWFGTRGGLNRFDGYTFKQYIHNNKDTTSIAENIIAALAEDDRGRIWVFTEGGMLDCFDRKTGIFHHFGTAFNPSGVADLVAQNLYAEPGGRLWVVCNLSITEMLLPADFPQRSGSRKDIRYQQYTCDDGLPCSDFSPDVWRAQPIGNDRAALLSTTGEIWLRDVANHRWDKNPVYQQYSGQPVTFPMVDHQVQLAPDGRLYQLINRELRCWYQGKLQFSIRYPKHFEYLEKAFLQLAPSGDLWMVLDKRLYKVSANSLAANAPVFEEVIGEPICHKMLIDKANRLWIGTVGYGIRSLSVAKSPFTTRLPGHSLGLLGMYDQQRMFASSLEHDSLMLWGISAPYTPQAAPKPYDIACGRLWSRDGTCYTRFRDVAQNRYWISIQRPGQQPTEHPIPVHNVRGSMLEDPQGRVWITGGRGELLCHHRRADRELAHYTFLHLWQNSSIELVTNGIICDKRGNRLWLGTTQGLVQMDINAKGEPTFRLWADAPGSGTNFSSNHILSLLEDLYQPDKYLWVGTNGGGLCKMDKQTGACVRYSKTNGLPDNVISGILADDFGNLWLSTNFGLSRFSLSTKHFHNFTAADGLQDNEFNTISYIKNSDGTMFFGGVKGLTIFHPKNLLPDTSFSAVVFTELRVNNQPIGLRDSSGLLPLPLEYLPELRLRHHQNFISLSFSSLNFKQIGKESYFYKLDGVDEDWVFAGNKTEVNYPNLSPGTYTLLVANTNEAGIRNPHPARLRIVVLPPWWRSPLAYLIYFLLLAGGIWRVFHVQVRRAKMRNELIFKEKEAQQLQALDELKTRFFTNITHEFRTPLTLILEPVRQLLQAREETFQNPKLQLVANNSQQLLHLVNQLLDVAKLEEGKMQLHPVEGDILPIIREIFDYFGPIAQRKKQKLVWDCPQDAFFAVADRAMLEKIAYNLLSNAHKFTPEGGEIRVKVATVEDSRWQLTITDTGVGIAATAAAHIFDRFYQADGSHTRKGEGTGIGLALVKELTELAGGNISVQSTLGQGSAFIVTLPQGNISGNAQKTLTTSGYLRQIPTVQAEAAEKVEAIPINPDATSVLLVEDNDEMRHYVRMTLESAGYAVLEAENGAMGIDMAREHIPDLVISDVMMPEKDGFELTATLKQDALTSHIPIVLLTAKGRLESKIAGYEAGADAYLPKPFYTEELLVRLRQLLDVRQVLQQKYAMPGNTAPPDMATQNEATLQPQDAALVARVHAYICEHLSEEDFSIEGLAGELAMSRSQLYRKVTALTGMSPARLIREHRLKAAHELLVAQPALLVAEVGLMVGIHSEHHFRSLFREQYGYTPQEARARRETP